MTALGTKQNPIRILVADNWGEDASNILTSAFPKIKFSVYKYVRSSNPHGHMVAECICHMLPEDCYAEIVFLPYIPLQNQEEYHWMNVIEKERNAGRPFHVANCSFGSHHKNVDQYKTLLGSKWDEPHELEYANKKIGDTIVVFAAGNQDSSTRMKDDLDNDVNYPQKPLSKLDNVYVIGACDKFGIPSTFSSDGKEVVSMYLGEDVIVFDPFKYSLTKVNGTSFAAPFCSGNMAENMIKGIDITPEWYLDYVLSQGWIAEGWVRGDHHRKAGYGCMLPVMYNKYFFQVHYVAGFTEQSLELAYHDFDKV